MSESNYLNCCNEGRVVETNKCVLSLFHRLSTWRCPHVLLSTGAFRKYRSTAGTRRQSPQLWIDRLSSCPGGCSAANRPHAAAAVDRWDRQTERRTYYRRTDGHAIVTQTLLRIVAASWLRHSEWYCLNMGRVLPLGPKILIKYASGGGWIDG